MKEKAAWSGLRRFATMAGDVFLFNISVLIAFYLKFGHVIPDRNFYTYEKSAVYISIVFLVVNFLLGVYVFYNRRVSDIIFTTVLGQIITIAALIMITFIGRLFAFPRMVLVYSFIVSVIVLCIWRVMVFFVYLRFTSNQRVVVLANETELPAIVQNFNSAKNNKHKVTHVITANFVQNAHKVINDVDIFYLTKSLSDDDRRQIIDLALKHEKQIMLTSTFDNLLMLNPNLMNFEDESVMGIRGFRITPENAFFKRLFDIVVALLMLVVASPFMLVTAILVKVTSPGPIIYKQVRITMNQREFHILKFRTMTADAESKSGPMLAQAHDSRITSVGKYLRKLRLDELPQIFNVLRGDMSIVGPRPERPFFVDQFNAEEPHYYLRHNVRAGITGYAQVYGKYASDYHSKLKFDLLYIKCYSIFLDAKILLQTIKILFDKVSSQGLDEDEEPSFDKLEKIVEENDIIHLQ
ncbi:sugar transferase [Lacticaseibacillus manihotivorans]|uniref:Exopolysaccharide biosynthesis polyprenyl glycosylphosphotransferase n=1 Tax=Lacticaseibacillus manihotivorans TaxID=88233 RepID=A0A5P8JUL7_9LACO|nr:sugar transferase [Lacticaseibacillus manihotivorans]QFQ92440.1 exopolysaccharide biosynthesis polyprenyl glycosylphosphotransferase [Lacticaseibacillus manihotivorans]